MRKTPLILAAIILAACQQNTDISTSKCHAEFGLSNVIKGQHITLGNNQTYPEERERQASFNDFQIDKYEVTNGQFAEFVEATNYVTTAEKPQAGFDVPGAAVFMPPTQANPNWWQFVEGANWRHPDGPDSSIAGKATHPVVQISHFDALAYAEWAGRDLPSEVEWEYAAKAGADTLYVWGEDRTPNETELANTWQGAFPIENTQEDGHVLRAPVGCYPPNDLGLYDMIGNVWEWTKTDYATSYPTASFAIKGGSFLCAENYCARYRGSARQPQEADLPTNHIGFRTVKRKDPFGSGP